MAAFSTDSTGCGSYVPISLEKRLVRADYNSKCEDLFMQIESAKIGGADGQRYTSALAARAFPCNGSRAAKKPQDDCSMDVEFTAHNIRLDDGSLTKAVLPYAMDADPRFVSARGILEAVFPASKSHLRIADLGCLEGGYSVEFARMGFQVVGVEVRASNIAACEYVKSRTNLPNLVFAHDNAWNVAKYGTFDAVFCCGLLYHLDRPKQFLEMLSTVTKRLLILQTHFAYGATAAETKTNSSSWVRKALQKTTKNSAEELNKFRLSEITKNEGLEGRWYTEFADDAAFSKREGSKWASWDNQRSFWIQREHLLQTIRDIGFDLVLEQFDNLRPSILESMLQGEYRTDCRGTFIGLK